MQINSIKINKALFRDNSKYVRDALVAAVFEDKEIDVYANSEYLLRIVKDALSIGLT